MNDANKAALFSILRSILITAGGIAVTKGYLSEGVLEQVVGAVLVIASAAWGAFDKLKK